MDDVTLGYLHVISLEKSESLMYTTRMHTVYLALGSNLGNKKQNIMKAVSLLQSKITSNAIGKLYKTKPMYYVDQDMFLNTVISGKTTLSPQALIAFTKQTEKEVGRQKRFHNGPREIDIDIIFYDQLIYESVDLIIPHPRMNERLFVLEPLADLDPFFTHPVLQKSIKELLTVLQKNP